MSASFLSLDVGVLLFRRVGITNHPHHAPAIPASKNIVDCGWPSNANHQAARLLQPPLFDITLSLSIENLSNTKLTLLRYGDV